MSSWWQHLARYWKAFLTLLFLPVFGSWFADEARDLIYYEWGWKEPLGWPRATTGTAFGLLVAAALLAVWATRELFRPRNVVLASRRNPAPHPHLVLFLSNLHARAGTWNGGVPTGLELTGNLEHDLAEMVRRKSKDRLNPGESEVRWLWEMPLRGLHQHAAVLRGVTLVCSKESLSQAHWFAQLLTGTYEAAFPKLRLAAVRLLVREGKTVRLDTCPADGKGCGDNPAERAWDFEEFDELFRALEKMAELFESEGVRERDIMIDVTGGQKPNSIVGAMLTVNRRIKFQYVQTNTPYEVIAYDLMTDN